MRDRFNEILSAAEDAQLPEDIKGKPLDLMCYLGLRSVLSQNVYVSEMIKADVRRMKIAYLAADKELRTAKEMTAFDEKVYQRTEADRIAIYRAYGTGEDIPASAWRKMALNLADSIGGLEKKEGRE